MAKATSQQSKYLLRIRGKQDFCLAFGQRTRLEGATDKVMGNEYSLLLTSLHVCKEMYKPGVIEADVQIIKTKYAATSTQVCAGPDDAALFDNLLGARVDLTDLSYEKEGYDYDENMAKDYIFYNYEPRFENVGGVTGFYVRIYAYSPDKMLTLRRYSACYTGKVLGEDILIDIVDSDKNAVVEKDSTGKTTKTDPFVPSLQLDLHQLSYQDDKKETFEIIQPYLVQQNETEHEFISRVANRCGEFFFYENGALHLGCVPLKNAAGAAVAAKQIGIFRELTMPGQYAYDDHVPAWISDYMRDDVTITEKDSKKKEQMDANRKARSGQNADVSAEYYGPATDQVNTYTYDDKSGFDDFCERMGKNTAFDIIDGYTGTKPTFWIRNVKNFISKDNLSAALSTVVYDLGQKVLRNLYQCDGWKDKYKTKHIDTLQYSEMSTHTNDKTTVSPYSNYAYALDGKFYSTMAQLEKESAKTVIRVVMEADNVRPQFLGSTFLLNSSSTDEYAIVKVTYDARQEADGATRTYSCVVEAVKKVQPSLSGTKPLVYANQEAFVDRKKMAYEDDATNTQYLPLPLPNTTRGKARPQVAIVMDVSDPCDLNRVRIKYPWQKKIDEEAEPADPKCIQNEVITKRRKDRAKQSKKNLDNLSPWIRVSTPMAGNGYGVKFLPRAKDEVMVDYENGDMERPFVVGSLYSQRTGGTTATTSITSPAGDVLQFFESSNQLPYGCLKSFLPILKTFQFLAPNIDFDTLDPLSGGMVMQDRNGLNKIMLSTPSRTLSISSSLGNVTIDAFKGITIKAPSGKISIEGKDIEIKASNKLTLQSGGNIKKTKFFSTKDFLGNMASDLGENIGKDVKTLVDFIDIELARCFWDAIMRPVDGTLLIHSGRYLCLEGGSGTAALPKTMVYDDYQQHTDIQRTLRYVRSKADKCEEAARFLLDRIFDFTEHKNTLINHINSVLDPPAVAVILEDNTRFYSGDDEKTKEAFIDIFNKNNFSYGKLLSAHATYEDFETYINGFRVEGNYDVEAQFKTDFSNIKETMRLAYDKIAKFNEFYESIPNLQEKKELPKVKFKDGVITFNQLRSVLQAYVMSIEDFFDRTKAKFLNLRAVNFDKNRRILYYLVIQLWNKYLEYDDTDTLVANRPEGFVGTNLDSVTENAANWKTYVSGLKYKEPVAGEKNFFAEGFTKAIKSTPLEFYTDDFWKRLKTCCNPQFIWNPENKGGVLIADNSGHTCEINGTSITPHRSQEDLRYLEDVLK